MLLGSRMSMWGGKPDDGLTAKDYVRDGLIFQLDGIENAGPGRHSSSPVNWCDLTGGKHPVEVTGAPVFGKDRVSFDGMSCLRFKDFHFAQMFREGKVTVEVIYQDRPSDRWRPQPLSLVNSNGITVTRDWQLFMYNDGQAAFKGFFLSGRDFILPHPYYGTFGDITAFQMSGTSLFLNGALNTLSFSFNGEVFENTDIMVGGMLPLTNRGFVGDICSVRIYDRVLTEDEIRRNYMTDVIRFNLPATRWEWKADKEEDKAINRIRPFGGELVLVDWGDGSALSSTASDGTLAHIYGRAGTFVVTVSDNASLLRVSEGGVERHDIPSVVSWGDRLETVNSCFFKCRDLRHIPGKWPDSLTSAYWCYQGDFELEGQVPPWPPRIEFPGATYAWAKNLTGAVPRWDNLPVKKANTCYYWCSGLTGPLPKWPTNPYFTEAGTVYFHAYGLRGIWDENATIEEVMPPKVLRHDQCVTGCDESVRKHFFPSWGGTRPVPGADGYVQEGLVAQWDGIENVAYGEPHDPNAAVWTDLKGGIGLDIHNGVWADGKNLQLWRDNNGTLVKGGARNLSVPTLLEIMRSGSFTVEYGGFCDVDRLVAVSGGQTRHNEGTGFKIGGGTDFWNTYPAYWSKTNIDLGTLKDYQNYESRFGWEDSQANHGGSVYVRGLGKKRSTITLVSENGSLVSYAAAARTSDAVLSVNTSPLVTDPCFTLGSYNLRLSIMTYFFFRVYSRPLSEAEVQRNCVIDKERFNLQ